MAYENPPCRACNTGTAHSAKHKKCQHCGLQLSWPNAKDARRAIVATSPSHKVVGQSHTSEARFVHTSIWDVDIYNNLTSSGPSSRRTLPPLSIPLYWNPHTLEVEHKSLLQYFKHTACQALTTFGHNPDDLGNFLLRMSLSDDSHSTRAVLKSVLAFSSLHRNGVQSQAAELKISALGALGAAAQTSGFGTREATQHVAAGMLLYSFEIHQASCTSSQWTWYLVGVKQVINTARLGMVRHDDTATLLDWVYYNDVMARFSLRHWDGESPSIPSNPQSIHPEAFRTASSPNAVLELLSVICDSISVNSKAAQESEDHKGFLKVLDWRIRNTAVATAVDELYQLSMLVYLDRISGTLLNQPIRTQKHSDKGFTILSQLRSCERQFPVFILGCEARTDNQRAIILDLISKTEKNAGSRSFNYVKLLLEAIWAQDDLTEVQNGHVDYWNKLSSTMSRCAIPPSFV